MTNASQTIIQLLEEEKSSLLHMINMAVHDEEYLLAHYHKRALMHVIHKLDLVKGFEDDLYAEKNDILETIERIKKIVATETNNVLKDYFNEQIKLYYKELESLNKIQLPQQEVNTENVLDTYLDHVLNNNIRQFSIVLYKDAGLKMEIRRIRKDIRISLLHVSALRKNGILTENRLNKLSSLGFLTHKQNYLFTDLKGDTQAIKENLKSLLSVIVFDVFSSTEWNGQAYIVVK